MPIFSIGKESNESLTKPDNHKALRSRYLNELSDKDSKFTLKTSNL